MNLLTLNNKFNAMTNTKLLLALYAIALTGCEEQTQEQRDADMASHITEFSYKGHRYIKYEKTFGLKYSAQGYAGITHDPDCPCRKKGCSND